ncbi:MAG: CCA tRNA nucleotidyltransferase [Candidatus Hydrogenedentes bacterium]|nr:CCA tRNA nucleotidyltransferase [Candidatus Hydrogenedentota bacterium]
MDDRERAARDICAALRQTGHRALFAGGCVRDLILGHVPKDYDIATSARASEVMALFPRAVGVGAAYGVVLVVRPEGNFEVATFRRDGPYLDGRHPSHVDFVDEIEDARRRDFTVNALFLDPHTEMVLDYVEGQADIRAGVLRTVGEPEERFREDHLRLVRAARFAARLDYTIDDDTFAAMRRLAPLIQGTSPERIRDEVVRMLTEGGARRALEILDATGLLKQILPEVAATKGVEQPAEFHPEGDVWEHVLRVVQHLEGATPTLAMGALLHDVGKPLTQSIEDRIRFNNHDKVGARVSEDICRRLRFSNEHTARIVWLVEQHMRVASIPDMRESKRKRFVREPGFDELLTLCRIDCLASHGDTSTVEWVRNYKANLQPEEVSPPRLITGDDLVALGYAPGPLFREILTAVEDAQLEGALTSPAAAQDFVQRIWPR